MRQIKKLFFIPLLLFLSACPSKDDPHTHHLWINCEEDKGSSNLTPEKFMIEFTITHNSDHQHLEKNQLLIKKEEVVKTVLWKDNLNYAVKPYFSIMEIALHINEKQSTYLTSRNIQYHINRNTLEFGYTYTRSNINTGLVTNSGGIKTQRAGKCRHIANPRITKAL